METLQKEDVDEQRETRDQETNHNSLFYSPCYFFQQLLKFFFKCFGHENDHQAPYHSNNAIMAASESEPPTESQAGDMNITREFLSTSLLRATRRPPRSGLSNGAGGQTN